MKRAAERAVTRLSWLEGRHSFNFGPHYSPDNEGHGLLIVHNDDIIQPGAGFNTHSHRDMEIVTWVLAGRLEHKDSTGTHGIITPGLAQRMSAGRGIEHSEINPSADAPLRLVQMWVQPDTEGIEPGYEQVDVSLELEKGGLVAVASGNGHAAIRIQQGGASFWAARLKPGGSVKVPDARFVHVFVATGSATLEGGGVLAEGDAARLTAAGSPLLSAGEAGAEVLVWET